MASNGNNNNGAAHDRVKDVIKLGSRESTLAKIQTLSVVEELKERSPRVECTVTYMKTYGDKILDKALSKIGKNVFTKELEEGLADEKFEMVVHSLKDLPTANPDCFAIPAILERADPRDCILMHPKWSGKCLKDLPDGSVVGSSSVRRCAQLAR